MKNAKGSKDLMKEWIDILISQKQFNIINRQPKQHTVKKECSNMSLVLLHVGNQRKNLKAVSSDWQGITLTLSHPSPSCIIGPYS